MQKPSPSMRARGWITVKCREGILYIAVHTHANLRVHLWGFHQLPIKRAAMKDSRPPAAHKHNNFCSFYPQYERNILRFLIKQRTQSFAILFFFLFPLWGSFLELLDLEKQHIRSIAPYPCLQWGKHRLNTTEIGLKLVNWVNRTALFWFPCSYDLALKVKLCFEVIFNQTLVCKKTPELTARLFWVSAKA